MMNNTIKNNLDTYSNSFKANYYTTVNKRNWSSVSYIPPVFIFFSESVMIARFCELDNSP